MLSFNLIRGIGRNTIFQRIYGPRVKDETTMRISVLRNYASAPKRFYKNAGIVYCDGLFEITLDHRKLKTPKGNVMKLDNEILALMVATEWEAQKEEIQLSTMHLTALCNTALENPNNVVKEKAIVKLVDYLETDAVLYHCHGEDVFALQQQEWDPIISWFCKKYDVNIAPTTDLVGPTITTETKESIRKHLLSYNMSAIHGFNLAIESLKSIILTLCCVERRITVDKAVLLSRLEEDFQAGRWGRVEWGHDMNQLDIQSRVAAGVIFIQINSLSEETKSKLLTKFN